jgi:polyphosphate glucokinase
MAPSTPRILAIDVGGTRVKVLLHGQSEVRAVRSGKKMRASDMAREVRALTRGWRYDVVAMGYPGVVCHGRPATEPHNLGCGWVGFDYHKAFGRPVRIVNDAAMQAIGSYSGGRMLFLGLGTGLGVAIILNGALESTEIGHLLYKHGRTYEEYLGKRGMHRLGHKKWRAAVTDVTERLREAFEVDYVVLGGGNARKLKKLPPHSRLGDNANAFVGAFRLWLEPNWVRLDTRTRRAGAANSEK